MELNGTELNGTGADARAVEAEAFARFWRADPRKEAKGKAEEVWKSRVVRRSRRRSLRLWNDTDLWAVHSAPDDVSESEALG